MLNSILNCTPRVLTSLQFDYDVDAWLRMAWFDPRLRHGSSRPVLINEYTFLKKIWRPDPIFTNSKAATFHKVTYLNFFMFIFPSGEVFLNIRVYLKPTAAQIVLCKYPHDSPACSLKISSLGFTQDVVRFEWFSKLDDAIQLNHDLQIPELTLLNFNSSICDGTRKSGNYSCLEAHFYLKREIGYHIAQTYIPTAICVVFSWISVWLPEEFVEGRIFVSLTVFLTLSAESNSAKEELPKVSYIKVLQELIRR
uniref:Neur_chan_LBD domain-containing protein n=1 Tax=Heterorhabditis bacteriophora TaxID=37862 RepID=A0A1I7WYH1_HETBA